MSWGLWLSIGALVFSLLSFFQTMRLKRAQQKAETIREVWDAFDDVSSLRLEYSEVSHVIEMPEYYDSAIQLVKAAAAKKETDELAHLLIKERALARRTYSLYEQMLFEFEHASKNRLKDQAAFLKVALENLAGRLLLNPRLAYYWQREEGLGVSSYFESNTHDHYDKNVRPHVKKLDPVGAFSFET